MIRTLLTLALGTPLLFALTLDEAIERAVQNNPQLGQSIAQSRAKTAAYDGAYSAYKPSLTLNYSYTRSDKSNYIGSYSDSSASAELKYNLFNGFADHYGIEVARFTSDQAARLAAAEKADLVYRVTLAYSGVLRRRHELDVSLESLTLLERQLADAKNFYEQGVTPKNDYLQTRLEHARAAQQKLEAERNLQLAHDALRMELGGELAADADFEPIVPAAGDVDPAHLKTAMLQHRSELQALRIQRLGLDAGNSQLSSAYYPTVDATLRYQKAGEHPWPDGGKNFKSNDESSINISMEWVLYEGGILSSKREELRYESLAMDQAIRQMELELERQLSEALSAHSLARAKADVAHKGLEAAEENYRIANERYRAGVSVLLELLEARRALERAHSDYNAAYFDIVDAIALIERVTQTPFAP